MKRKLVLFMAAALLSLTMTGCGNVSKTNSSNSNTMQNSELSDLNKDMTESVPNMSKIEPVAIPDGGWTVEAAAKVFYINGNQISVPFTIENLGENYSIKEDTTQILDSGDCGTTLYYNDIEILTLNYKDIESFDQLRNANVQGISTYWKNKNDKYENNYLVFNGIHLGSSSEEVELSFGEADKKIDNALIYVDKDTQENVIGFLFNDNGELYSYSLILQ
ncbi:hypothetical protein Osc1_22010 [Hominimerdicola sp. 21CYCFAH17_S]